MSAPPGGGPDPLPEDTTEEAEDEVGQPPWFKPDDDPIPFEWDVPNNPPPDDWDIEPSDEKPDPPNPAPPWFDDAKKPNGGNPPPEGWTDELLADVGGGLVWSESENRSGYIRDADFVAKWAKIPDGVEFAWQDPSAFKEGWGEEDPGEATLLFWVPWGQKAAFKDWVMGGATRNFDNTGLIDRITPLPHPDYPWLFALSAKIVANAGYMSFNPYVTTQPAAGKGKQTAAAGLFSGDPSKAAWGKSLWEVVFRPRPYTIYSDELMDSVSADGKPLSELHRYVSRSMTHAFQFLPIPQGSDTNSLRFVEGPYGVKVVTGSNNTATATAGQLVDPAAMNKFMFEGTAVYDWYFVPDINTDAFTSIEGTVNDDVFDPPFQAVDATGQTVKIGGALLPGGFPRETLLCMAPTMKDIRDRAGKVLWHISFRFLYRPQGWNHFPAADGKFWLAGFNAGNPIPQVVPNKPVSFYFNPPITTFYDYTDFNRLFTLPTQPRLWVGPRG